MQGGEGAGGHRSGRVPVSLAGRPAADGPAAAESELAQRAARRRAGGAAPPPCAACGAGEARGCVQGPSPLRLEQAQAHNSFTECFPSRSGRCVEGPSPALHLEQAWFSPMAPGLGTRGGSDTTVKSRLSGERPSHSVRTPGYD